MTKEQKQARILQIKAEAFDDIEDARLTIDSHRNFHHVVERIVREAKFSIAEVNRLSEALVASENLIRCYYPGCKHNATSQVDFEKGDSCFYCENHTNEALADGARLVVAEDLT